MPLGTNKDRALLITAIILTLSHGIDLADTTTGPTTVPSDPIQSKYDRFEDITNVALKLRPEISLSFSYDGQLPTKGLDSVLIACANSPQHGAPVELIWLADGNRERLPLDQLGMGPRISVEFLDWLSNSKKLELAIIYENGRVEITFTDKEVQLLNRFYNATPDAAIKAEAARRAAAAAEAERELEKKKAEQRDADKRAGQLAAAEHAAVLRAAAEKRTRFGRVDGKVKRVMYLCQASGSMLGPFGQCKIELNNSIQQLAPDQAFNLVFFSDDNVFSMNKAGPVLATTDNKVMAKSFVDNMIATGGTQPIPAIKLAFDENPDLIFVVTNGFTQAANLTDVSDAFAKGNADNKTKINCIFFKQEDDPKFEDALEKIVQRHGGAVETILPTDY